MDAIGIIIAVPTVIWLAVATLTWIVEYKADRFAERIYDSARSGMRRR